jgi:single-stranded DNA-binding protein
VADTYRTFTGFVKFDLNDGDAAGKPVRSFVIRQAGVKDQALDIRCTLWPSHDSVELEKGDAVLVEGKFTVNKAKDKQGDPQTYFNLSVSNIIVLGPGDRGERVETANTSTDDDPAAADDDIPY